MAGKIYSEKREIRKANLTREAVNSITEFKSDLIKALQTQAKKVAELVALRNRQGSKSEREAIDERIATLTNTNKFISSMNQVYFKYADYAIDQIRHGACDEKNLEKIIEDPQRSIDLAVSNLSPKTKECLKALWSKMRTADLLP